MAPVGIAIAVTIESFLVRAVRSIVIRILVESGRVSKVLGPLRSFLHDGAYGSVLSHGNSNPSMVVVYAGPVSRVSLHQGLLVSDHLVELLQLSLLLCQLILHDSSSSGRRTHFFSLPVTIFWLSADSAPLLAGPVSAPAPALTATPAATL